MRIVTTHKNTDFDGLASVIAATLLYPDAIPVLPRQINPNVKGFLSIHKDLFEPRSLNGIDVDKIESLILVDVNSWSRVEGLKKLKGQENLEIIVWDHHISGGDINATWMCREEMGATITLLLRELKKQKKIFTSIQSTLFLIGLYEDTGNLTFPSTKSEDAYAAAYLMERKADLNIVSSFLRPAYGERQKNVLFEMLSKAQRSKVNGHKISISKLEIEGHVDSLAVVVRMYREILSVDAAFGIFHNRKRGNCMIIGRSHVDSLNIGSIMRSMGGGGHPSAGSAVLKSVNPDVVAQMIQELIQGNQQASVQISDLMSFPVYTVQADTKMAEAAAILKEKGCTGVPVVSNGKLVGIISRRDFRKLRKESQLNSPVKAYMSREVVSISPGKSPMAAAGLMIRHDVGRLPVVENDKLIGIITRSDAMIYFYDLLPD
ncbi:CBS domain-containing protein [Thermodesulfobacteriota bacterium]